MTVHEFCKARQITIGQLAKEIGYNYGTLRNVSSGHMRAGLKLIRSLERISNGKISLKDLRPDLYTT
jgi:hypothetical protein